MANPLLTIELPAETLAHLARLAQREHKITSSRGERERMQLAMSVIQAALDSIPCPLCRGENGCRIRRSVWDEWYAEIAAEYPDEAALTETDEREIEWSRSRFAAVYGAEWQPCPKCQSPAVQQRRAA